MGNMYIHFSLSSRVQLNWIEDLLYLEVIKVNMPVDV